MNKRKYEKQNVTVDIVIMTPIRKWVNILLIKRVNNPFKDMWAIPGGYLDSGETLEEAAYRELKEETSLSTKDLKNIPLKQFKTFGDPGRDPRGRVVSVVYYALIPYSKKLIDAVEARDDAKEAKWFRISELPEKMAFDHLQIIEEFKSRNMK